LNPTTVAMLLQQARQHAPEVEVLDAQLLLVHVLERSRAWLYGHATDVVASTEARRFLDLWRRRANGEPYAYLTGMREFHGREFRVNPNVLIPRADTECLLEAALARFPGDLDGVVVDAGTGSGALGVCFALERPRARVVAVDRSAPALRVAAENARRLGASVDFVRGHWLASLADASVDLLLSNPPYLGSDDPHLAGEIAYEPLEALVAGPAGLEDIEILSVEARRVLRPGAWVLFEHGSSQGAGVRGILSGAGFTEIQTLPDLEGRERVSLGRRTILLVSR
jgi:release factor glutamine methyltransferase